MSRHPEIKWAQRTDQVFLTVLLPDSKDAKINLEPEGVFTFTAKAGAGDQPYEVKLELFDKVNVEESKINIGMRSIFVIVEKADKVWWKKLLRGEGKAPHYVKVDWDKWVDEDEEETAGAPDMDMGGMDFSIMSSLHLHLKYTDSSSSSMSQIRSSSSSTITETRSVEPPRRNFPRWLRQLEDPAHIPIFSVRKRKRSLMEPSPGRRLSEPRSTKFSRVSAYVASFEVEGSIGQYLRCSENIQNIEESDLRRSATSKIASFVNAGLLSGEQASVAVEHFGAAAHGLFAVEMWLGLMDDKKIDYIKSLRRQDTKQLKLTPRRSI